MENDGWREVREKKNFTIQPFAREFFDAISYVHLL
jgi:hypothetical protein